ncbi:unnamed protein product [Leptosia nina]|uniref:Complex I assembly factor TIMMDC1, mitochondrial n=1 Tax=Leptosia nina TaxID=320188 RepID=A0AAV1JXF3_9NEOP
MFRFLNKTILYQTSSRLMPAVVIPFFNSNNENDYDMLSPKEEKVSQTGWNRVQCMFKTNDYHELSIELHNVLQTSLMGVFFGVCYGGFTKSRDAYIYFIENNQATSFKSNFDAKRKLQDYVTIAFARGAYRWGWKLGIFSGIYSLIATTISVYRDKNSVLEYIAAGAITGSLYKANLGLAASIVGAGLGAALGVVGGLLIVGMLKVSGVSMDDIRRSLYSIKESREKYYNKGYEDTAEEKNDNLTRHHDVLVETKGPKDLDQIA